MQFSRALRFASTPSTLIHEPWSDGAIAFVGAGGKTTAIFQLAHEIQTLHKNRKYNILVTATSHLATWQISQADHHVIAESGGDLSKLPEGVVLVTGPVEGDRTQPVNLDTLKWLYEYSQRDNIPLLIEADGSRGRPLKAPAAHEPPIPDFVETVIVHVGLRGLGKPLDESNTHRPNIFANLSGAKIGEIITGEALIQYLLHPDGGLKNIPLHAHRISLLNQADTPVLKALGGQVAQSLFGHYDSILVGSLQQNDFQTFEQTAGIILAAGESSRFGKPKQLLDWKGKPFVRQVAETAIHAGLTPLVIVTGCHTAEVESALSSLPVSIVYNGAWHTGQASSIRAGIASLLDSESSPLHCKIGSCVFLLADQPQIPVEVLHALIETHTQTLPAILAPLVQEERRANPVLFDRITFPNLLALTGDVGGRAIFNKYKVEYLPWHDELLLLDVDTPEDYERLKQTCSPP